MGDTHVLDFEPSAEFRDVAKGAVAMRQGMMVYYNTSTGVVEKATDATTNRKAGGMVWGYDQPASGAQVRVDIGGCKARIPANMAHPSAGGTIELTGGAAGSLDTVTADGVEILQGAVAYGTSLTATAAAAAKKINQNNTRFFATSSGATITIRERIITKEAWTLASTITTMTKTDTNASGGKAPLDTNLNADVYPSDEYTVKFSGTAKIGFFDDFLDKDGVRVAARAGLARIKVTGDAGTLTQLSVGATTLLVSSVAYSTSAAVTAGLIRDEINLNIGTHGYFAVLDGDEVIIYQTNASLAEDVKALSYTGSLTLKVISDMAGGVKIRPKVRLIAWGLAIS